ncbi:MAG: carboxy terminal-processing peptidase [Bacteroidia bacterium]|jgi:carboxyl-terminal processing protease|nr:carboxy terminal-processing peptidase [Bacteroidia bacterium]
MIHQKIIKPVLLFIVISLSSFTLYQFGKNQLLLEMLMSALDQAHYSPLKIDDEFSEKAFTLYLKRLDTNKKFLLKEDVDALAQYKQRIDDEIQNGNLDFYNLSIKLIAQRIKEKENWSKEILSKPLDYSVDEEYQTDGEKTNYATSISELKMEWVKMLKYQVLTRLDESLTNQEKAKEKKDSVFTEKSFDSLEVDARRKTLKANEDWFKRLSKITSKDRYSAYLNTITGLYDPHTEYFAPKDKKKFDQSMSGQFEGIGARLQAKDGILKVSEIIVGSPSFKQGELKAGDEIHKVAQGMNEPVDITNMDMDDAIDLIKGKKGTEVRLTVKKPDATFQVIAIIRDVIEMEETYAKSAILTNKKKLGYIYLPMFYADFTRNGAHRCSDDIRKEVEKLKKENVEGIILDLRDNGGGSLQEVVEMAGLFIPKGPMVQVKGKMGDPTIMENKYSKVVWEGPLAVLVNHGSASASEILAAAIQDYKRGIIIGTQSYGKGTVQSFLDLDQYVLPQFDSMRPLGSVKITMQKFYRVNGGATQLKGVMPDVSLPDPYAFLEVGEKDMDYPMPWDEISKATYQEFRTINHDKLKKASNERVKQSAAFKLIDAEAKELKAKKDDTKYNLKLDKYRAELKEWREQNKKYDGLKQDIKGFNASLMLFDKQRIEADTTKLNREIKWTKNISKDNYIFEASNVLNDMK